MIKIELDKKLRKIGLNRNNFEADYANSLLDFEHKIVTVPRRGPLVDRFGLGLTAAELNARRNQKAKLEIIFFQIYSNTPQVQGYIDHFFHPIRNAVEARALLKEIILLTPDQLKNKVHLIGGQQSPRLIGKVFDYSRDNDPRIRPKFTKLGFKVCIYCNRNYTSNFSARGKKRATFTLDHFYQKGQYSIFSLSLYNLIPACAVCNTNIKNTRDVEHYENPHSNHYNFHDKAKFRLLPNYQAKLITSDHRCFGYIRDFYINEVYDTHHNEIKEFVRKREVFTDDMIRKISKLTGHPESRVKSQLFGESIYNRNIGDESLGKLKADLGKELGLT